MNVPLKQHRGHFRGTQIHLRPRPPKGTMNPVERTIHNRTEYEDFLNELGENREAVYHVILSSQFPRKKDANLMASLFAIANGRIVSLAYQTYGRPPWFGDFINMLNENNLAKSNLKKITISGMLTSMNEIKQLFDHASNLDTLILDDAVMCLYDELNINEIPVHDNLRELGIGLFKPVGEFDFDMDAFLARITEGPSLDTVKINFGFQFKIDQFGMTVASLLKKGSTVKHLAFLGNGFIQRLAMLTVPLQHNCSLTKLVMPVGLFNAEAGAALGDCMKSNSVLNDLTLVCDDMSTPYGTMVWGLQNFAERLNETSAIKELILQGPADYNYNEEIMDAVMKMAMKVKSMTTIVLHDTIFHCRGLMSYDEAIDFLLECNQGKDYQPSKVDLCNLLGRCVFDAQLKCAFWNSPHVSCPCATDGISPAYYLLRNFMAPLFHGASKSVHKKRKSSICHDVKVDEVEPSKKRRG